MLDNDVEKRIKKQLDRSAEAPRAFTSASVDRSSISSASVAADLFPNLSRLVSLNV